VKVFYSSPGRWLAVGVLLVAMLVLGLAGLLD